MHWALRAFLLSRSSLSILRPPAREVPALMDVERFGAAALTGLSRSSESDINAELVVAGFPRPSRQNLPRVARKRVGSAYMSAVMCLSLSLPISRAISGDPSPPCAPAAPRRGTNYH